MVDNDDHGKEVYSDRGRGHADYTRKKFAGVAT
jgi:hypothetical protein